MWIKLNKNWDLRASPDGNFPSHQQKVGDVLCKIHGIHEEAFRVNYINKLGLQVWTLGVHRSKNEGLYNRLLEAYINFDKYSNISVLVDDGFIKDAVFRVKSFYKKEVVIDPASYKGITNYGIF